MTKRLFPASRESLGRQKKMESPTRGKVDKRAELQQMPENRLNLVEDTSKW